MSQSDPTIPWPRVTAFIRQLNHDLRNHLNAIELQSAFLGEIVENGEAKFEIKRLREMTAEMGAHLQRLSSQLADIHLNPMPYEAAELMEDLRGRIAAAHPQEAATIQWTLSLGNESLEGDPQLLLEAFTELLENALAHGRGSSAIVCRAEIVDSNFIFTLCEPKSAPLTTDADWGAEPLGQPRGGHYALGLFRARGIFQAHHGTMQAEYDSAEKTLLITVRLPLSA